MRNQFFNFYILYNVNSGYIGFNSDLICICIKNALKMHQKCIKNALNLHLRLDFCCLSYFYFYFYFYFYRFSLVAVYIKQFNLWQKIG